MKNLLLKIFIVSLFLTPGLSQAYQLYLSPGADITITATPANPGPYQDVIIKVQSYSYDLDRSLVTWQKDGKQLASNGGLKTFAFRTGPAGSQTIIGLTINSQTGEGPTQAIITFSPIEIELLWQANSYTPYWYQGKAQPSENAQIMVSAIIRAKDSKGKEVSPQSLIYNWKKDGKNLPDVSGVGKSSLLIKGGAIGSTSKIEVAVSSSDQSISSGASTDIKIVKPKVIFYEDKPLVGTAWQKTLNKESNINGQMVVRAEPFYFSNKNLLNFAWYLNNQKIASDDQNPARLYLKASKKNVSSRISLRVTHPSHFLQDVSNSLIITSNSSGSF